MIKENVQLECKIRYLEDKLLRSNNKYEIESLRADLFELRRVQSRNKINATRRGV